MKYIANSKNIFADLCPHFRVDGHIIMLIIHVWHWSVVCLGSSDPNASPSSLPPHWVLEPEIRSTYMSQYMSTLYELIHMYSIIANYILWLAGHFQFVLYILS